MHKCMEDDQPQLNYNFKCCNDVVTISYILMLISAGQKILKFLDSSLWLIKIKINHKISYQYMKF